jgi:hypothetical protein
LDSEINGNDESKLVLFTIKNSSSTLSEQGRSSASTTDNWISLSGIDMTLFPSAGSLEVGFNNNEIDTLTWNGKYIMEYS